MATFPTYPATTFEQAVNLAIFSANQLHDVINDDATSTIDAEDGAIPSLRKSLVDNFYFKSPIEWTSGTAVTVFNQLYYFHGTTTATGYYYAPSATTSNPITMGTTPVADGNWVLYSLKSDTFFQEVGVFAVGAQVTRVGDLLRYNLNNSTILARYLGTLPHTVVGTDPTNDGGVYSANNPSGLWELIGGKSSSEIYVEDYEDANSAAGDWTTALQNAINASITQQVPLYGYGKYYISNSIVIDNDLASNSLDIYLDTLGVLDTFPASTGFWDATPMIIFGGNSGNLTGMKLHINTLRGGTDALGCIADGIVPKANGFALSDFHLGNVQGCRAVIRMGAQVTPNASMVITGNFWTNNYVGVFMKGGTGTGIIEGWKFFVKFIAANYWAGIWFLNAGQYAQVFGDHDYNGRYLGVCRITDGSYITQLAGQAGSGGKLTDGTTELEYICYFTYQGTQYLVVAADYNMAADGGTGVFPWTAGSTIGTTVTSDVALKFDTVQIAADNSSKTNFFDILHDFENAAFAKIQVVAGYMSQIIGGGLSSSTIFFQNSFSGATNTIQGLGFSNGAGTLALYNKAISDVPIINMTSTFTNFQLPLFMQNHQLYGFKTFAILSADTTGTGFTDLMTLTNPSGVDKNGSEGSRWNVQIMTNFAGVFASFDYYITDDPTSVTVTGQTGNNAIFEWRLVTNVSDDGLSYTGVNLQVRQSVQPTMQFGISWTRIG